MTLLTPEQQARLDAAVAEAALSRSPQTSSFLAGQSPEKAHRGVCKVGKPHSKHRKQPGTGTHWGSVFDSTREPVFSIDERDPNYDEDDVAAVSAGTSTSFAARSRESPRVDSVALYKHSVETLLLELFSTGDVGAARVELQELEQPLYGHYAVKKAVRRQERKQSPTLSESDVEKP
jgi:programmed cell death protein 4